MGQRTLPAYLGFGTLDPTSVREVDGVTEATYVLNGKIVHYVRWSEAACRLEDRWAA